MAIYYDRNAAQEEGSALIPDMPGYSDFKHKPFEKMVTEQDQIWWLYWHYAKLLTDTSIGDLDDRMDALEENDKKQDEEIKKLREEVDKIKCWLYNMVLNSITYDVTQGKFAASIATNRRNWQAQNFTAMRVDDLATYTVEEAAKLNIRHIIVDGRSYYMGIGEPDEPAIAEQMSYSCADFNPDEYVKKSDLTLIDTDNLEAHEIMGVLKKDSGTDYPDWVPYMRPYTAYDLAHGWVLFNDHVIAAKE